MGCSNPAGVHTVRARWFRSRAEKSAVRIRDGSSGDRCAKTAAKLGTGERRKGGAANELRNSCGGFRNGASQRKNDLAKRQANLGRIQPSRVRRARLGKPQDLLLAVARRRQSRTLVGMEQGRALGDGAVGD